MAACRLVASSGLTCTDTRDLVASVAPGGIDFATGRGNGWGNDHVRYDPAAAGHVERPVVGLLRRRPRGGGTPPRPKRMTAA